MQILKIKNGTKLVQLKISCKGLINMKIEYNKLDIVAHLMNQSIKMFFHKEDAISIHLLASAANEILTTILKTNKIKSVLGCNSIIIKDEYRKDWIKGRKSAYNFFKHADKDTDKSIAFDKRLNLLLLLENINFLLLLKQKLSREETFFTIWILVTKRNYLTENEKFDKFIKQIDIMEKDFFDLYDDAIENYNFENIAISNLLIPT